MWDCFKINIFSQDFRKENTLHLPLAHSTRHEIKPLLLRGCLFWNNLPGEIKGNLFAGKFKKRLKRLREHGALPCYVQFVSSLDVIFMPYSLDAISAKYCNPSGHSIFNKTLSYP